jgi:1-acyl-sn-glycerol-3-phosphate acyltransferase
MAKKELFSIPILRGIMRAFGAVKLDRGGTDVAAIRSAIELAKSGDIVAIFPQGHRYPKVDPSTTPIKHGAALIAYRSGCGIIPACIKTKNNKYRIFKRVTVIFGKPIDISALGFEKGDKEVFRKATELVFSKILEMGEFGRLPSQKSDEERKN